MWFRGQFNPDAVAWLHVAAVQNNPHHPCLTYDPGWVRLLAMRKQARLKTIDLMTWIAQASQLDDRFAADPKQRPGGKAEQVDISGCDVFSEITGSDSMPLLGNFVEKLRLDQVNLPEIVLPAEPLNVKHVLIRCTCMGVALYSEVLDKTDLSLRRLAEAVLVTNLHANDLRGAIFVDIWCAGSVGLRRGVVFFLHISNDVKTAFVCVAVYGQTLKQSNRR